MVVDDSLITHSSVGGAPPALKGPVGILFITDQFCTLGGAERALLRIVNQLPRERFSPRVMTFKVNQALRVEDSISCPLHVLPLKRTYDWNALRVATQIRGLVRKHSIRIAHTFHETSDLWAGPIAKLTGCPVLISSRRDMGLWRGAKHRVAYRCLSRYFDEVQTVSEEVRRHHIEKDGLAADRVLTVYNGVDVPSAGSGLDRASMRERFGLSRFHRVVTSVGHVRSVKGFDVFVRAAAEVKRRVSGTGFVIAGEEIEPGYASHLRDLSAKLGLGDSLVFLGDVPNVKDLLRASDVFCLLSRSEGLSNAVLEAMACGLPCVVTAVGGNPELIESGRTGFLVENEDAEAAAIAIVHLLTDPKTAQDMGLRACRTAEENFTTDIMMRRLTESYDRLLQGAGYGSA